MRSLIAFACVCLLASTAAARSLAGDKPKAAAAAKPAASVAEALQNKPKLSTLLAAVKAAGIEIPGGSTILAPTNEAFTMRLQKDLKMTPQQLLMADNKATLKRVLQYHVIPGKVVKSSDLKDGQMYKTALDGALDLVVRVMTKDNKTHVKFVGATNAATVMTPDVMGGSSVVHVVKDVLLPAGVGIAGDDESMKGNKTGKMMGEKGNKMNNKTGDMKGNNRNGQMTGSNMNGQMTGSNVNGQMMGNNRNGQMTGSNRNGQMTGSNMNGQMMGNNRNGQMTGSNMNGQMTGSSMNGQMTGNNMNG